MVLVFNNYLQCYFGLVLLFFDKNFDSPIVQSSQNQERRNNGVLSICVQWYHGAGKRWQRWSSSSRHQTGHDGTHTGWVPGTTGHMFILLWEFIATAFHMTCFGCSKYFCVESFLMLQFNPVANLSENNSAFYNPSPSANDKVHLLVCVLSANSPEINPSIIQKMKEIREAARDLGENHTSRLKIK